MSNESVDLNQAYLHFGRHTEAGRLIYALYSAKQNRGAYKPNVKVRRMSNPTDPHEQHLQSLKQTPRRAVVKVPKPIKRRGGEDEPRFPIYGGRKPAELILRETQELFSKERMKLPAFHPVQPRSQAIAELQDKFSGESHPAVPQKIDRKGTHYQTTESFNEAMISQLHREIEEREQFLEQVQGLDKKMFERIAPGVNAEIRQRTEEIQKLSQPSL